MLARLFGLTVALVLVLPVAAEARPDARRMRCADLNALIAREGWIVITTGTHTYRDFASSSAYCEFDQILRSIRVKTADNPQCLVRGVCEQSPFYDLPGIGDGFRHRGR